MHQRLSMGSGETVVVPFGDAPAAISRPARLASLDAFRGLIMITLISGGLGVAAMHKQGSQPDNRFWQSLAFHTDHPPYLSQFTLEVGNVKLPVGVSYWDLIQPSFMFMVGVAMPFSYAKRRQTGQRPWKLWVHVIGRSIALILLGVFLGIAQQKSPISIRFTNVLAQIGLGYTFAFLFLGRRPWVQFVGCASILALTWGIFVLYHRFRGQSFGDAWAIDHNAGLALDGQIRRLIPLSATPGGYVTLNFLPSIVTMIIGILCGEFIRSDKSPWTVVGVLFAAGAVCLALGTVASFYVCPVVKKLWTPSWTLYSAGYVIWILALLYAICDAAGLRQWSYPLIVVGANSLLAYLMSQLLRHWTADNLRKIFGDRMFDGRFGPMYQSLAVMLVFWLILLWLYRQKAFVRI